MKFINLVFQGIANQNASVNLENKIQGGITVTDLDKGTLKDAISFALFGAMGDTSKLSAPAKAELSFVSEDATYTVIRTFRKEEAEDEAKEYAMVTDFSQTTSYAEGVAEVDAFLSSVVHFTPVAFNSLFLINKEDLSEVLCADSLTRESYIAVALNEISSIEDIQDNTAALKEKEEALISAIEQIAPVTRKEIKAQLAVVKGDNIVLSDLSTNIDVSTKESARVVAYEQDTEALSAINAVIEKAAESQPEVDAMIEALASSQQAEALIALYKKYDAIVNDSAAGREALNPELAKLYELENKVASAEISRDNLSKKYIYLSEKESELNKAMVELIASAHNEPDTYLVKEKIDSYYKETDLEAEVLREALVATEAEKEKIETALNSLQERKLSLRNKASFRKIISDGAVMENRIKDSNIVIDNAIAKMQANKVAHSAKYDEHVQLSKQIEELAETQDKLISKIVGNYANYQEAVNADAIYKQSLYGKHLTVSASEVEIVAIEKKILAVDQTTDSYQEKLDASLENKEKINEHLSNLKNRLKQLETKFADVAGEASLSALAEGIEYGSRCPICSGFVMAKNDLGSQSTKAIETQIASIKDEILLGASKIESLQESIGQYSAAKVVSENYAASLAETVASKRVIINKVLVEYGVGSITELFNLLKATIAKSNNLTINLDTYRNNNTILNGLVEKNNAIVLECNDYTTTISAQEAEITELKASIYVLVNEYKNIQPDLNGQNAEDLVAQQHVINKEYEEIEVAQEELYAQLKEVASHREEILSVLNDLEDKVIKVDVDGEQLSYHEIAVKVIMSDLNKLGDTIVETATEKDIVKVRLAAINKIIETTNGDVNELVSFLAMETNRLDTQEAVAQTIYDDYADQIADLGVSSVAELEALILPENIIEIYSKGVTSYDETAIRNNEASEILQASIKANQPYYDNKDAIQAEYDALKTKEFAIIAKLHEDTAIAKDMEERYTLTLKLNKELSFLQARLERIEEIAPAITETTIIAKDFATIILNKANSLVKNWTDDRYKLYTKENGQVVLFNNKKGKDVRTDKPTKEESMILSLALPLSYISRTSDLLGFELTPALQIKATESDKNSLIALVSASTNQDLIVFPEDEVMFMKTIGRI
ncbi:MAG: hypothetical protein R3Y23_01980 [Bacillota bacterium]